MAVLVPSSLASLIPTSFHLVRYRGVAFCHFCSASLLQACALPGTLQAQSHHRTTEHETELVRLAASATRRHGQRRFPSFGWVSRWFGTGRLAPPLCLGCTHCIHCLLLHSTGRANVSQREHHTSIIHRPVYSMVIFDGQILIEGLTRREKPKKLNSAV